MNIFKKIGSFATSSWKDFSEFYDQQPLNETESTEAKLCVESSFELRKRHDAEIDRKKASQGFFRKRFSKKKLLLDDPRSPTLQFQRTPIVLPEIAHEQSALGILSPFNVQDMLASIDTAIVTDTPKKVTVSDLCIDNKPTKDESENLNILDDDDFVANIGDWNDFKFNEKVLTESLIVEVSTLDINSDLVPSNDDSLVEESSQLSRIEPDSDDMQQCLLQEEEKNSNCKVVGCIAKGDLVTANQVDQPKSDSFVATSTPKKMASSAKLANDKKVPRTPLVSIRNSPMVNKTLAQNSTNSKPNSEKPKKKKVNSTCSRQLPKAPTTPLTPLFKNTNKSLVSHFDKENF